MIYLIIVSIIWALSFSLIKGNLTGIDSNLVAFIRLGISFFIFLPFLKIKNVNKKLLNRFFLIGSIQYGLMYVTYIYSYQFLEAYQIAVLTIFTPLFVILIYDWWNKKLKPIHLITSLLAVIGAGVIVYSKTLSIENWKGILLIQISNLCFAFGQVYFKKIIKKNPTIKPVRVFSIIYLGAAFIAGLFGFIFTNFSSVSITPKQWFSLIYLGVVASGIGFFLWNVGVTKVTANTLAVLNNLKIPLGVIFAFLILGETTVFSKLIIGTAIIVIALFLSIKYESEKN